MGHIIKKYLWILGILCSVIIGYLLARTFVIFIEKTFFPQSGVVFASASTAEEAIQEQTAKTIDIDAIIKRNFFDPEESVFNSSATIENTEDLGTDLQPGDKAVQTTLGIKLKSAMSSGDGRNVYSSCVVDASGKLGTYTIKDKSPFGSNTKIVRILARRVEFTNNGRLEYVDLEDFAKLVDLNKKPDLGVKPKVAAKDDAETTDDNAVARDGDSFQVARAEIDKALENMSALYTDIRAVPYYDKGKPSGFKLLSVKRGSLFEKLGLRRYDILKSINGQVLDIQSGMNTFSTLKNETDFSLELERGGQPKTFKYQVI